VLALAQVPAVVAAEDDLVDLLVLALTDIAGPEIARHAVEAEPPRVAEAHAKISGLPPPLRNGLSLGTVYVAVLSTLMRSILPRNVFLFRPWPCGSPPEPPSPNAA
jgi:hypothetical protein